MGSLMPGWDSPVLADHQNTTVTRNRSLMKEEVEAFWREHRKSPPPADKIGAVEEDDSAGVDSSAILHDDWWTRSSWAFLNEPPLEEAPGKAQNYTPQFHVARIATAAGTDRPSHHY